MRFSVLALSAASLLIGALLAGGANGAEPPAGPAQIALDQASQQGQYSFLLFYEEDNPAVQNMIRTVDRELAERADAAPIVFVQVTDPAEQATVARFNLARAPMPLLVALAPNGAVTGMFARKLAAGDLAKAFVTPAMTRCMKAMQDGRLVIVCVETPDDAEMPEAVGHFQEDPQFKNRLSLVSLMLDDPEEAKFLDEMRIDVAQVDGAIVVVLAPPGVLIGKFDDRSTANDIAAAVHEAGQCCDDPNCRHNHPPRAKRTPAPRSR